MGDATTPAAVETSSVDESQVVLHVRPDSQEWGSEDDDRWRTDLAQLQNGLRLRLPEETQAPGPAPGGKGVAELNEVILALGSAGAFTAMVEVIKTWIGARPGRRKVKVDVDIGGEKRSVMVDADGLGAAELATMVTSALAHGANAARSEQGDRSQPRE